MHSTATADVGAGVGSVRNALASKDREHFVPAVLEAIRLGYITRKLGTDVLHPHAAPPAETRLGLVAELDAAQAKAKELNDLRS